MTEIQKILVSEKTEIEKSIALIDMDLTKACAAYSKEVLPIRKRALLKIIHMYIDAIDKLLLEAPPDFDE